METLGFSGMKGCKISSVVKVMLDDILSELHFNIECQGEKRSFAICICDDAETIKFSQKGAWTELSDIGYQSYSVTWADRDNDDVARLIGDVIIDTQFGIGRVYGSDREAVYYFKMETDKRNFLFFDSGDQGWYLLDGIDEVLLSDPYDCRWDNKPPRYDGSC